MKIDMKVCNNRHLAHDDKEKMMGPNNHPKMDDDITVHKEDTLDKEF